MVGLDFLDTGFAEAVATAGGLVGVSKNRKTDGALRLDGLRRCFNKFTVRDSSHVSSTASPVATVLKPAKLYEFVPC